MTEMIEIAERYLIITLDGLKSYCKANPYVITSNPFSYDKKALEALLQSVKLEDKIRERLKELEKVERYYRVDPRSEDIHSHQRIIDRISELRQLIGEKK